MDGGAAFCSLIDIHEQGVFNFQHAEKRMEKNYLMEELGLNCRLLHIQIPNM